jgi:hypothetical protein
MSGVFDITLDKLDFNKIRMHAQSTAHNSDHHASREVRTRSDILQCVRKNTLVAFVHECRMYNIDALHALSLQVAILLMSKCTDRMQLCRNFMSYAVDAQQRIEVDESVTTMIDSNEAHALQSTSDWVSLFRYLEVVQLTEAERSALRSNARVAVFVKAMRPIFAETVEIEAFIRPMLCTILMHIPAASMLERVLLAEAPQHRDIEVMCLRAVNSYVDQCQHMSNDTNIEAISLLVRSVRVNASFHRDVAAVINVHTCDDSDRNATSKKQFSLRRHIRDQQGATVLHRALLFAEWQYEMKFSVNVSPNTQRVLYFVRAQTQQVDMSSLKCMFDQQMLAKTLALSLERIDADAVTAAIKTLRVYQYNVKSLLEFRTTCLVGFNQAVRQTLTLPVVLQLYVACWQHPSIREQCWRSIIPVSNFAITSRCNDFRHKYPYEQASVLQTLLYCHTENHKAAEPQNDAGM